MATHSAKTATCELYNEINYPSAGAARIARCADSTLFSGSYEDFLERDIQMLATLRQREQNCTDTSSVYSSKSAECDAITIALSDKLKECLAMEVQLSYDSSFTIDSYQDYSQPSTDNLTHYYDPVTQTNCGPYEAKVVACSNYAACYTSEVSMMDSSYLSAKELSSSRQAEMTALNRIVCLLDVLQLPAAEQPAKLTECIAAIHDVSSLNLVKPVAPAKAACDPGATPAGCVVFCQQGCLADLVGEVSNCQCTAVVWAASSRELVCGFATGSCVAFVLDGVAGATYAWQAHEEEVTHMHWDDAKRRLFTSSKDKKLRVWHFPAVGRDFNPVASAVIRSAASMVENRRPRTGSGTGATRQVATGYPDVSAAQPSKGPNVCADESDDDLTGWDR